MADQKATALSAFTPVLSDILYGVDDPGGTPVSGKMTLTAVRDLLQANLTDAVVSNTIQMNQSANLLKGFIEYLHLNNTLAINDDKDLVWAGGGTSVQLRLSRDADDVLAQRRGTNAQTFNIYNTFTDASNYERGGFKWATNVLEVFAEAAGTGTQRDVVLNGANRATKISDPSGGSTVDSEARTAINAIIDAIEAHGIAATS